MHQYFGNPGLTWLINLFFRAGVGDVYCGMRAFRADPVRGRVLLVDDVYTTGSTVGAAASALRASGASSVDVVTFARAVRR